MTHHSTPIVVRPVRFTRDVAVMRDFLERLGLAPRIESVAGGWVDLVTGGGMVALHDAATSSTGAKPGQTGLSFEADDLDSLAMQLVATGFSDITVWDEAYGRVLSVRDPMGERIWVDERSEDLYGYRSLEGSPDHRLRVVPVRFTDDAPAYAAFLHGLGLSGTPDDHYSAFAAGAGDHGYVGVHHVHSDPLPLVPGDGSAQLTFLSSEPIDDLAVRLADVGIPSEVTREDFGAFASMIDPDGQEIQVHEAPVGG